MNKVKFITCIYSELSGTEFGGRSSRGGHYRWSLLSLLKMTDADFICYTSESEFDSLNNFYFEQNNISKNQLSIKIFDLRSSSFFDKLISIKQKNIDQYKSWDRCLEIQYNKFFWFDEEDKSYDYYFWIDAGLSHCGLLPNKWLNHRENYESQWYLTDVFDNNFLKNLLNFTEDKFFIIAKDNVNNYWSGTLDPKYYIEYNKDYHVIGGLFGGKKEIFNEVTNCFKKYLNLLLDDEQTPMEENILSLMNVNDEHFFVRKYFDVWWCADNAPAGLSENFFNINKSFYKIIEELI